MTTERPATKLHVMRMLLKYYNVFKTSRDSVQVLSVDHSADMVNKPKVELNSLPKVFRQASG